MPFYFDSKIDLGHFLTFLTILGGLIAWFIAQLRSRARGREDYARSGALRLILRLLRDQSETVVSASALYERYQSPSTLTMRKEYCRYDFRFKDRPQFDGALYRLEDEGKVRFDGLDMVVYRHQERMLDAMNPANPMVLADEDVARIMTTFTDGFRNLEVSAWDIKDLARVANRLRPAEVQEFLRKALVSSNWVERARATAIIEIMLP